MSDEKNMFENIIIYVFSYNRGSFLDNCLLSLCECCAGCEIVIVDDGSEDEHTVNILKKYRDKFRFISYAPGGEEEHKTGGLYNNMRLAIADAKKNSKNYVVFLQDDMQLVRPITNEDIAAADSFFATNKNCVQLQTCFMKRFFSDRDDVLAVLDQSGEAYLRPSNYPGYSGFSAVGLFNVERFEKIFGDFRKGEYANNEYAQKNKIQMGLSARPFMMWLPYPISYRRKNRNIPLKMVEGIAGCGYHPYNLMSADMINRLINRDRKKIRPYAEDWLECPTLQQVKVWNFAGGIYNLIARGGFRAQIGILLLYIKKFTGYR